VKKTQTDLTWRSQKEAHFTDLYSGDNRWLIAQGYDTHAADHGQPFLLMYCPAPDRGSPWRRIDAFKSIREAKRFAEEMSE